MAEQTTRRPQSTPDEGTVLDQRPELVRTTLFFLGVCLLWVLVAGGLAYFYFDDWIGRRLGSGAAVLFFVFAVFGALWVGITLQFLQALVNPSPRLVLASPRLAVGAEHVIQLRWVGNTARLREVRVEAKGQEGYSHASPKTGRGVFFHEVLLKEQQPVSTSRDLHLVLPEEALPSFQGKDHLVEWEIVIRGEIPWWVDVHASFPLSVSPGR